MRGYLRSYRTVSLESEMAMASPHKVIQMMLTGLLDKLIESRLAIKNNDLVKKGMCLGKAVGIINGLKGCLDMDQGGEIAKNLNTLYFFTLNKVSQANIDNDLQAIDDALNVLKNIKEGWDGIPIEQHNLTEPNDTI